MLGCQNNILHAGFLGYLRPGNRIIVDRIECLGIGGILLLRSLFRAHDPFAATYNRVQSPVDEHAKPVMTEPLDPFFSFFGNFHEGAS